MAETETGFSVADLRGLSQLAIEAAIGVTQVVEGTHRGILNTPGPFGAAARGLTGGVTSFVYGVVKGAMRLSGKGVDFALARFDKSDQDEPESRGRDIALAALNGVIGDHLLRAGNALALHMRLRHDGRTVQLDRAALAQAIPAATGRIVVLIHGLCMSDLQWTRNGHDHGAALAREAGYTPLYLFYNTGLHISTNGRALADMLEQLATEWPEPIKEFVIIGHSMGGLLARSACHCGEAAGHSWRRKLSKLVFLGAPHHGAPLERVGAWAEQLIDKIPYASDIARIGRIRSAGITDLRYGNIVDEDWTSVDLPGPGPDKRAHTPLPDHVACYAIAATTAEQGGGLKDQLIGDGLVQVDSALGRHADPARDLAIPAERQCVIAATGHLDLLSSAEAYAQIALWLAPTRAVRPEKSRVAR